MDRSPDVHAQEAWIGPATLGLAGGLFPRPFRLPAPVAQRGHTHGRLPLRPAKPVHSRLEGISPCVPLSN